MYEDLHANKNLENAKEGGVVKKNGVAAHFFLCLFVVFVCLLFLFVWLFQFTIQFPRLQNQHHQTPRTHHHHRKFQLQDRLCPELETPRI